MSWFKKMAAGVVPALKTNDFFKKLNKEYRITIDYATRKNTAILYNPENKEKATVHLHDRELGPKMMAIILSQLGINFQEFFKEYLGSKKKQEKLWTETIPNIVEEVPDWQKSPWYQKSKQYT